MSPTQEVIWLFRLLDLTPAAVPLCATTAALLAAMSVARVRAAVRWYRNAFPCQPLWRGIR